MRAELCPWRRGRISHAEPARRSMRRDGSKRPCCLFSLGQKHIHTIYLKPDVGMTGNPIPNRTTCTMRPNSNNLPQHKPRHYPARSVTEPHRTSGTCRTHENETIAAPAQARSADVPSRRLNGDGGRKSGVAGAPADRWSLGIGSCIRRAQSVSRICSRNAVTRDL